MAMICEVREHEGRVYAVHSSTSFSEPKRTELWWEMGTEPGLFTVGAVATWDGMRNVFEVESARVGESTRPVMPRNPSREAQAERVLSFDVPPPKTRLETRWHDGAWQRHTVNGWK